MEAGGRNTRFTCLLFAMCLLTACVSPYGPIGIFGGIDAKQTAPGRYSLHAKGNGSTSVATLQSYMHRKATELCPNGFALENMNTRGDEYSYQIPIKRYEIYADAVCK